jgi:hypothetical protein
VATKGHLRVVPGRVIDFMTRLTVVNPNPLYPKNLCKLLQLEKTFGKKDFPNRPGIPPLGHSLLFLEALFQLIRSYIPAKKGDFPKGGFGFVIFQEIVPERREILVFAHD